ncbi:excisionase family DNA-binding protein [Novosphingobium nitrogenifigens]|uniref:excisionase family DNA-binding protein n=1 Tax=Novosphingobium nitrogenifigens TaxID=378548 RepID=UPI0009D78C10
MSVRADGLLSPRELAALSGWSTGRIRALISENQIRHIKVGSRYLLPRDAMDEFVANKMISPQSHKLNAGE